MFDEFIFAWPMAVASCSSSHKLAFSALSCSEAIHNPEDTSLIRELKSSGEPRPDMLSTDID